MRKLPLALTLSPRPPHCFASQDFSPRAHDCNVTVDPRQRSAVPRSLATCAFRMADSRAMKCLKLYLRGYLSCVQEQHGQPTNQPLKFYFLTLETAVRRANTESLISRRLLALAPTSQQALFSAPGCVSIILDFSPSGNHKARLSPRGLYF